MLGHCSIYALAHPETGEVRYIGKTSVEPLSRLRRHVRCARGDDSRYCAKWIRTLLRIGLLPTIQVLVLVERDMGSQTERAVIALYRSAGVRLTNLTDGGDGAWGYKASPEANARRSAWMKGNQHTLGYRHTTETLQKMSKSQKGRKKNMTPEGRKRLSDALRARNAKVWVGRHHSQETKDKIRAIRLGSKASAEARAKMSAMRKGKPINRRKRVATLPLLESGVNQ